MGFRTLTFGHLETAVWGVVWDLDDGRGFALVADGADQVWLEPAAAVRGSDERGTWELAANGLELQAVAESEPAPVDGGFDQLTRIQGTVTISGGELSIDCLGRRGARDAVRLTELESLRDVTACFEPDQGMAVFAARPRGAVSHADDLLSASAFQEGHALLVEDPRLSTTYLADGLPVRASLELWPPHPDEDQATSEGPEEPPAPRAQRAAGEAIGPRARSEIDGLDVDAALFRWHSRGRQGAGVYVLARAR